MMKSMYYCLRVSILLTAASLSMPNYADTLDESSGQETAANTQTLASYLLNLGAYLGFNIAQTPPRNPSPLLNLTCMQLLGSVSACSGMLTAGGEGTQLPFFTQVFDDFLGSIPVNTYSPQFVPTTNNSPYAPANAFANATFPAYNTVSSQQSSNISVNSAIDQKTYQQDPVSQSILNILGTPNYTNCMNYDATAWTGGGTSSTTNSQFPKCASLYEYQVMNNVLGSLPPTDQYFSYNYNQQFLSQLNGNTLVAPLLYSTTNLNSNSNTSSSPQTNSNNGLTADTQAQQAANFIRYATGEVAPISLPKLKDYDILYNQAMNLGNNPNISVQMQAQATLISYLTKLRVYAAQVSVGYSNLYYIFSKRMPQNMGGSGAPPTSQALNEFTMATWRLYNPSGSANTQWINEINSASTATVQKEMVTLLAEINYQLYLTRQQEERLLLTNTMLLMLGARTTQPSPPIAGGGLPPQ